MSPLVAWLISVYHFASSPHLTTLFALPSSPCPAVHVDVRQLLAWPRSDLTNIASEQNFSDHALRRLHTYLPTYLPTYGGGRRSGEGSAPQFKGLAACAVNPPYITLL